MTQSNPTTPAAAQARPPALRIRGLREDYGDSGLSAPDLARLAGIPLRLLEAYEQTIVPPQPLEALVRIAFALQVPIDALLDAEYLKRIRLGIARRRQSIEDSSERGAIGFRCRDE